MSVQETTLGVALTAVLTWIGAAFAVSRKTGNRLSIVETKVETMEDWLERVEGKLDRVIEHR
jgi:cob(I)alamin adenosyltransferase